MRSGRTEGSVLVMFLDLDLFKVVNDSLGHPRWRCASIDVARRCNRHASRGHLARFGGDEFVIVCDGIAADEVTTVPEQISASLMQPFASLERARSPSAPASVSLWPLTHRTRRPSFETRCRDVPTKRTRAQPGRAVPPK